MNQDLMEIYATFVDSLIKPPHQIIKQMNGSKMDLIHMCLGITGEAGELVDVIKKHVIYDKKLDFENLTEELGDMLFYIIGLCSNLGISLDECLIKNMEKLKQRYPDEVYTDDAAIKRADKQ